MILVEVNWACNCIAKWLISKRYKVYKTLHVKIVRYFYELLNNTFMTY